MGRARTRMGDSMQGMDVGEGDEGASASMRSL